MAKATDKSASSDVKMQRPPAERLHAEELARLAREDAGKPRPAGWLLPPDSIRDFILGNPARKLATKFVGERRQVERCIVALATNRGLMLIGEPGTAKSLLSELLAAAICGDSSLTIQGSAGTSDDDIKYSWNYALLVAEGPSTRSLVPAPLYRGMAGGKIVRFEEITRCPLEMQDCLLSVLSDRVMSIPELPNDEDRSLYARPGFSLIATANTRDRGVNDMSAALKRRLNFETIQPIRDLKSEMALVQRETSRLLADAGIPTRMPEDLTAVLVTVFHELRRGEADGKAFEAPETVMSTAEAVSVSFAATMQAFYYPGDGGTTPQARELLSHIGGAVLKDSPKDVERLRHYLDHVVKKRAGLWQDLYAGRAVLS